MINAAVRSRREGRYLETELSGDIPVFEMNMIESITAGNILKPIVTCREGRACLSYNVTDCRSFRDFFAGKKLCERDIRSIILQLNDAVRTLSDHLLNERNLMFSPECIFVDKYEERLRFCAHPDIEEDISQRFGELFGELLRLVDLDDMPAVRLCARLFREAADDECRMYDIMNAVVLDRKNCGINADPPSRLPEKVPAERVQEHPETAFVPGGRCADRVSMSSLDDIDVETADSGEGIRKADIILYSVLTRLLIPQLIVLFGLLVIYLIKGKTLVIRLLPVYAVFSVCLVIYATVSWLTEKRASAVPGRTSA